MTFPEQLGAARRTLHRALARRLSIDTRRPLLQLLALSLVARREVETQAELADRLTVDAPAVSRLVAKLEADGLLTRLRGADRRCVCLRVTPLARPELAAFRAGLAWLGREVRRHISAEEQEVTLRVMRRLQSKLGPRQRYARVEAMRVPRRSASKLRSPGPRQAR